MIRDVDGAFNWYDLVPPLQTAMQMLTDLNLSDSRKIHSDTIAQGGRMRMVAACDNPRIVLGVFSKILPSVRGMSQEAHEADCAELGKGPCSCEKPLYQPGRDRVRGHRLP